MMNSKRIHAPFLGLLLAAGTGLIVPAALLGGGLHPAGPAEGAPSGADSIFRAKGTLESVSYTDLRNQSGHSLAIRAIAPEGKIVREGDLLVELDASLLQEKLEQQRVLVEKTQAELAEAEASSAAAVEESHALTDVAEQAVAVAEGALKVFLSDRGEYQLELKTAEGDIVVARKEVETAAVLVRQLEESPEDPEVKQQLQEARLALVRAEWQLDAANARRNLLTEHLRGHRIAELKLAIAQKKLELARAKNELSRALRVGDATLAAARAHHGMEKTRLVRLERQVAASKIHAPHEGLVLYAYEPALRPTDDATDSAGKPLLTEGAMVRDGQIILRLAQVGRFKIRTRVPLNIAQQLATGQPAVVRISAFPKRTFSGRITEMSVLSPPRPAADALITVGLDDPSDGLRIGMDAAVDFLLPGK